MLVLPSTGWALAEQFLLAGTQAEAGRVQTRLTPTPGPRLANKKLTVPLWATDVSELRLAGQHPVARRLQVLLSSVFS